MRVPATIGKVRDISLGGVHMSQAVEKFRSFWRAEEVPRSIGLLFVLVFIFTLSAMSVTAHNRLRDLKQSHEITNCESSVQIIADILLPITAEDSQSSQSALKQFAQAQNCKELRLYNQQLQVLASLAPGEKGLPIPPQEAKIVRTPEHLVSQPIGATNGASNKILVRAPILKSGVPATQFLEAVFKLDPPPAIYESLPLWMLLIALGCTTAFLYAYHRLRSHFHSFAKIADNLVGNASQIEDRLAELRINGEKGQIIECWNKLIDLTTSLEEEVARSTASTELLSALSKSRVGELAEAMATVPIGIILISQQQNILYHNAMAGRLIGWITDSPEAITLNNENVSADGKTITEYIKSCMQANRSSGTLDTKIEAGDGSFYHIRIIPVRTQQQSRQYVVLILDVSQQVRADKAREEFVSQVTHELRTPLTNIRAYAETLSSGMFDDPNVISDCYNVITKETRRLSRLVEDILSISQLEVGTMQLVLDNVELTSLLTESVRDVRGIAESKNIDLQLNLPPKLPTIQADRDKLAVVVNNLLGNAIKYTPDGGQVVLSSKATENQVEVSVRDTGIGIDPKDHMRIFEKFQRSDDADVQTETGTGIGLTTAREIIHQHHGDIKLVSKKGEGSTFTATIPLTKSSSGISEVMAGVE